MAFLPDDKRRQWLRRYAAWMDAETRDYLMRLGPYWYSPKSLGNNLELYDEDREKLMAWSIEAIDVTTEGRMQINREKNRKAQEKRRRKSGAKPQAQSERRTQPWKAMNISESTYRRRKKRDSISSRPSRILRTNDEMLSASGNASATPPPIKQAARPRPTGSKLDSRSHPNNVVPFPVAKRLLVGDIVGYVSPLRSGHYQAVVVAVNGDGTFDLDVDIPHTGTAAMKRFEPGKPFRISSVSKRKIAALARVDACPASNDSYQLQRAA
jgi:hypothetical protein